MKKRNTVKIILIVLCIILLCVFVYSGYKIITTIRGYKQAEKTYTEVANQFATVVSSPTPVPVESEQPQDDGIDPEVSPLNIDFAGLRAQSTDYVAWIYGPNTVINYPVVRSRTPTAPSSSTAATPRTSPTRTPASTATI